MAPWMATADDITSEWEVRPEDNTHNRLMCLRGTSCLGTMESQMGKKNKQQSKTVGGLLRISYLKRINPMNISENLNTCANSNSTNLSHLPQTRSGGGPWRSQSRGTSTPARRWGRIVCLHFERQHSTLGPLLVAKWHSSLCFAEAVWLCGSGLHI